MKNKAWIAVMDGTKILKRYSAVFDTDKQTVRVLVQKEPEKIFKTFSTTKAKPAVHVAREAVMLKYKAYDPQVHTVTVIPREEVAAPAPTPPPKKKR